MSLLRRIVVGRSARKTLARGLLLALICVAVFRYLLLPVRAHGISMQPAYEDGSLKLVNTLAYVWSGPARGEVVALRLAGRRVLYIKRVLGLPGERVRITSGIVYVNGEPLDEPYVIFRAPWEVPERSLGTDEYFVAGDNRGMAQEHHDFGIARRARIVGKVLF